MCWAKAGIAIRLVVTELVVEGIGIGKELRCEKDIVEGPRVCRRHCNLSPLIRSGQADPELVEGDSSHQ